MPASKNNLPCIVTRLLSALALLCCTLPVFADGSALFATTLADSNDRPVALSSYRGKPLVVNFWARWCPPCRAEIPELAEFRKKHRGRIEVLGIGLEDDAPAVRKFMQEHAMHYPVFLAREQGMPLMRALGNTRGGLPFTLFIDHNGQIVGSKLGMLRKADLDAAAAQLSR